jgi:hypothetical protein
MSGFRFVLYLSAGSGYDDADAVDILPVVLVLLAPTYDLLPATWL